MPPPWSLDVVALNPVSGGTLVWRGPEGLFVTVVVKATFALTHEREAMLIAPAPLEREDRYQDGAAGDAPSLCAASDLAPYLPNANVVLTGHAYAPGGVPAGTLATRLSLFGDGPLLDKAVLVYGDVPPGGGAPAPFQKMPLVYERAYGGSGVPSNPVGVGGAGMRRPNLVDPTNAYRPAGFGPIAPDWPARLRLFTGLAESAGEEVPSVPPGFDFRAYCSAPADQQLAALRGDEWVALDFLSPTQPHLRTRLPGASARARWLGLGSGPAGFQEVSLAPDTLLLDSDWGTASLLWRGHFAIERLEQLAQLRVFAGVVLPNRPIAWPDAGTVSRPLEPGAASPPSRKGNAESSEARGAGRDSGLASSFGRDGPSAGGNPLPAPRLPPPRHPPPPRPSAPPRPLPPPIAPPKLKARATSPPRDEERTSFLSLDEQPAVIAEPRAGEPGVVDRAAIPRAVPAAPPRDAPPPWGRERPRAPASDGAPPRNEEHTAFLSIEEQPAMLEPLRARERTRVVSVAELSLGALDRAPFELAAAGARSAAAAPIPGAPWAQASLGPQAGPSAARGAWPPGAGVGQPEHGGESTMVHSFPFPERPATPALAEASASPERQRVEAVLAAGGSFDEEDLSGADLSGLDFGGRSLVRCVLRGANLQGTRLDGARLREAMLEDAELGAASLRGADLQGAMLSRARGVAADLTSADLRGAVLWQACFEGASFDGADLRETQADQADFSRARFVRANLAGASLRKARLTGATLAHAVLDRADLRNADLERANLHAASRTLTKLAGANLKHVDEGPPHGEG